MKDCKVFGLNDYYFLGSRTNVILYCGKNLITFVSAVVNEPVFVFLRGLSLRRNLNGGTQIHASQS